MRALMAVLTAGFLVIHLGGNKPASAECFGNGSMTTCVSEGGTTTTTAQFENGSFSSGTSPYGGAWSSMSTRVGNVTIRRTEFGGQAWETVEPDVGGVYSITSGISPSGKPRSYTCSPLMGFIW